ncbi:hypothetical protein CLV47_11838 [Antricoccus suffuscus]|uniref:TrbL/VirB6 plasmid conjugal transfer protein n=1 Tax=Antricoccus suffuscus TaxID=1629062 RepID=A0A2T0ZTR6_9ACTN|nr:hypothetical protein [Antricoccus suffuscus]PRZ39674.1 hypothetical protein CLV47_11838 [Antricoccus suffuscus]
MVLMQNLAAVRKGWLTRVRDRAWVVVWWPLQRKRRFVMLMWLTGLFVLGSTSMAHADDLFTGPYTGASGDQATPFERYDTSDYEFLFAPDSNNDGLAGTVTGALNGIENGLFWVGASIIRGALIATQWMLGLDLYADNTDKINNVVQDVATRLLIPMLGVTLVIAGFSAYARAKREGGGTIFNDMTWIVGGSIFAMAFGLFPGTIIGTVDGARAFIGTQVMSIYSNAGQNGENALGTSNGGDLTGNPNCYKNPGSCEQMTAVNGSRKLVNGLWDSWVNTPYCYIQFKQLATCKALDPDRGNVANSEVMLNPDKRAELVTDLNDNYTQIKNDKYEAWNGNDRWIRGQLAGRLGAVLLFLLVSVPIAVLLLGLTLFGLMAAVGILLLVVVGPFFLALWVMPGVGRRIGMQWLQSFIAIIFQSILITLTLGAIAVVSGIINVQLGTYGYFMSSLFNVVVLVTAWRLRSQMENFAIGGDRNALGMSGSGVMSSYMAMRTMGFASRQLHRGSSTAQRGLGAVGAAADRASGGSGTGSAGRRPARFQMPAYADTKYAATGSSASTPASGRAGAYAASGAPMSAGEFARENKVRGRETARAPRAARHAAPTIPEHKPGSSVVTEQPRGGVTYAERERIAAEIATSPVAKATGHPTNGGRSRPRWKMPPLPSTPLPSVQSSTTSPVSPLQDKQAPPAAPITEHERRRFPRGTGSSR